MFKKIAIGALVVVFAGALIAGGIYRTTNKLNTQDNEESSQRQQGHNAETTSAGQGNSLDENQGAGRGGGGNNAAEEEVHEWVTLNGVVISVDAEKLIVSLPDGDELVVDENGWLYAQEQGFWTEPGHTFIADGFYEDDGHFVAAKLYDVTADIEITLREESGRPMWAGGHGNGQNRQ